MAEFGGDEFGEVGVDDVARLHHLAFLHQVLDDVDGALGHALRQFLNGDGFRQDDFAHDLLARFLHLAAAELLLATAGRSHRTATGIAVVVRADRGYRQLAAAAFVFGLRASRNLGGSSDGDSATAGCAAVDRAFFLFLVAGLAAANEAGCHGSGRSGGGLCHRACVGGRCRGRGFRHGSRGRFFRLRLVGAAFGLLGGQTGAFRGLGNATGFVDDALLGFLDFTGLGFDQGATARFHLAGRQVVQDGAARAFLANGLLLWRALRLGSGLVRAGLRGRRCGTSLDSRGCRRFGRAHDRRYRRYDLFVFGTGRAALARLDHHGLGPTATHVLAHGTLGHA